MKRILAATIVMAFVLAALTPASAFARPKGALQLGAGVATINGAPLMGVNWDVFTLHAAAMVFPSPWAALIADFSFGLPHDYEMTYGTDTDKYTTESSYLDVMAGACKHFTEGGFIYAGAGLAVSWSGLEISDNDSDIEVETGIGLVVSAGIQVPIKNTFMGFAGFRQRYISTQLTEEDMSMDMNAGGFEMTAGVAWAFGG